ncbi:extracellular calcium-sensing receptor-like [Pyxicephalus adspersus]|uniref:extracellular calcium-sensing receptor-like n=1 Tax=Pyxicephalus adspersus TaxID=30357 RepID=UPI003B58BB94
MNGGCRLDITELEGLSQPGDIMIGAMLPLHLDKVYPHVTFTEKPPRATCTMFHFESYQHLHALMFAVDEINKDNTILPNISIGFQVYISSKITIEISSWELSQQISYFSTSALLSDRKKFPSFFRTVPSDVYQSQGLAQLTMHFNWTWVGLLSLDNDYGQQGIQLVKKELLKAGACVAFSETILTNLADRNAPYIVNIIKKSTANTIIIFSSDYDLVPVLDEMLRQNITNKIFIASEAWSSSTIDAMASFSKLLVGTVGFALYSGTIPEFQAFLNKIHPSNPIGGKWLKMFWEQAFGCSLASGISFNGSSEAAVKECTGDENLENVRNSFNDVSTLRVAYNVYTAIHAVGKALDDLNNCRRDTGPQERCANIWNFRPWQLHCYIRKVRVKLSNGREVYFDENGDPPAVYDIVNLQMTPQGTVQPVKIGSYDTQLPSGEVFNINSSALLWPDRYQQVPSSICSLSCLPGYRKVLMKRESACCFDCVPCPLGEVSNHTDSLACFRCPWNQWPNKERTACLEKTIEYLSYEEPLGSTLTSISVVSSLIPVAILKLLIHHKTTPIVKASNYSLSCILLVCLSFCFLCPLVFIGYPQPLNCLLRQVIFGIVFSLCMSCVLAKTITVVLAFLATRPSSRLTKFISHHFSYTIISVVFLIQFIVCITWLCLTPPFPQSNNNTYPGVIMIECNEGSTFAFWIMLGYLGLLALSSFIVAFLARRLPDVFNEASYITFSMLTFLSVWVSYIPASLSAQGKYGVMMEIFAMLFSSWALVIFMFFPKCIIILFHPSMNSREFLKVLDPAFSSVTDFFAVMGVIYDDPDLTRTAEINLEYLAQGRRPVEEYAAEFRRWATCTRWGDAALLHRFRQGLSNQVKDLLLGLPSSSTLDLAIQQSICVDRRIREHRLEGAVRRARSRSPPQLKPKPLVNTSNSTPPTKLSSFVPDLGEPMEIGSFKLTPAERNRHLQDGLCPE